MSNFRYRLGAAAEILATGEGNVKERLELAVTDQLMFANVPNDPDIPQCFRDKHTAIINELSKRTWAPGLEGDRIRATIHPMLFKAAGSIAGRIWNLYNEFEEYARSGFIPENT